MNQFIGLGFDYQHRDNYAIHLDRLIDLYKTEISHLSIVGLASKNDVDEFMKISQHLPIIHHLSEIAPASANGPDLKLAQKQDYFSSLMNAKWCLEDIGIWSIGHFGLPYFIPPIFDTATLNHTVKGVIQLQQELKIPFLAEIPSCSFVVGKISLGDFFHELVKKTGCGMVLDVSHVYSYSIYKNICPLEVLKSLPLQSAIEIHIAGGSVHPSHKWRYRDTHAEEILPPVYELLKASLQLCQNIRAVTYEIGIGLPAELIETEIKKLSEICLNLNFKPKI